MYRFGAIIVSIVIIALLTGCTHHEENNWLTQQRTDEPVTVCTANKTCFELEVAHTAAQREYGLMHREFLAPLSGMLFVFERPALYPFWMKNTLIALDILRISDTGQVVERQTTQPCLSDPCPVYAPQGEARFVLELNAWVAEEFQLNIWSILTLSDK